MTSTCRKRMNSIDKGTQWSEMHWPRCSVTLASALKPLNLSSISSSIFCFNCLGNSILLSSFKNCCFISFTFSNSKKVAHYTCKTNVLPKQYHESFTKIYNLVQNNHCKSQNRESTGLTNLISSIGSNAFRILFDSSIFLIWSGV